MCAICSATPEHRPTAAAAEGVAFELIDPDDMDQA